MSSEMAAESHPEASTGPGVSAWAMGLQRADEVVAEVDWARWPLRAGLDRAGSFWMQIACPGGVTVGVRGAHCPGGLKLTAAPQAGVTGTYRLESDTGVYEVEVTPLGDSPRVLRVRSWVTPSVPLVIPYYPRDLVIAGPGGDAAEAEGRPWALPQGPLSNTVFLGLGDPGEASLLYLQQFSTLRDYFEVTRTSPKTTVGGRWPELGFSLPPTGDRPLEPGRRVAVGDAVVAFGAAAPDLPRDAGRMFLDLLSEVYLHLDRPETTYHDWPARAAATLRDLELQPDSTVIRRGQAYLNSFICRTDHPPESFVQAAVLLPLLSYEEYVRWDVPLVERLKSSLDHFWNGHVGTVVRWLPGEPLEEIEAGARHTTMDSWYLFFTLANLGELAMRGETGSKRLFLDSMKFAIKVAHRFEYRWPIMYHIETLEVVRAARENGLGETDVAGQYAYVMLLAHGLTGETLYLQEAQEAVKTLEPLGFRIAYQHNTTALGALALAKLFRITGRRSYLDLCLLMVANLMRAAWIWDCPYGFAKHYGTFFGIPPIQGCEYLALFEEQDLLRVFDRLLETLGDDAPASLRILLPEYGKHLLHRGHQYFPGALPEEAVVDKLDTHYGIIDRRRSIPLEDVRQGWEQAGQVGQQIYGAGAAPALAGLSHRVVGEGWLTVFCEYLFVDWREQKGEVSFRLPGDRRLTSSVWVVPHPGRSEQPSLRDVRVWVNGETTPTQRTDCGRLVVTVPGDAQIRIAWHQAG